MSGPVTEDEAAPPIEGAGPSASQPTVQVLEGRAAEVGGIPVTRLLPKRAHRTVGAWCFADHFGPVDVAASSMQVGPHPHIGLQTVTWLIAGEVVHHDSLGSEQPIRPGQLNLMTAGAGVAHAEETAERHLGTLHGVQLWVAQPEATRNGSPDFEHHGSLPQIGFGAVEATVLVGALGGVRSPARIDSPIVGAEMVVAGAADVPLDASYEHAVLVVDGSITLDGETIVPGALAYLGIDRHEVAVDGSGRAMVLGGLPFGETVKMWWNFVARTTDELDAAYRDWETEAARFGDVASGLARIGAPRPGWRPLP